MSGLEKNALLQAYRETEFRVSGTPNFVLHIDRQSKELLELHRTGVACSAIVTAWNPFSQPLTEEQNSARHKELCSELKLKQIDWVEAVGQHPTNEWPGEVEVLIVGMDRETASAMGEKWEQNNAVVWCGEDAIPRLEMLR